MAYNIILLSLGFICSILLFFKFPYLTEKKDTNKKYRVSIIIPARNEEKTLPFLLDDLKESMSILHEVICVDDGSMDNTKKVIQDKGFSLVEVVDKPDLWMGKSWACQKGAEAATGEILLFLDADVRINKQGIERLISQYDIDKCVISVLPYHKMEKAYERLSFFFNIIQLGGNGATYAFKNASAGLFGPLIMISYKDYMLTGGHNTAKEMILDDIAMGQTLKARGIKYSLYVGGEDISYRMYCENIRQIIEGWTKNYATGASMARADVYIMTSIWVAALGSTAVNFVKSFIIADTTKIIFFSICYLLWVIELIRITKKIGNFSILYAVLYPVMMLFFLLVFLRSVLKKVFKIKITWKGRKL